MIDDELLAQFVVESRDLVQQAAENLMALERAPADRQHLESVFRAIHTLKGSVGLFPLAPMQTALHAAEDVLSAVRSGTGEIEPDAIDPLLAIVEWTDRCVAQINADGELAAGATQEAAELVRRLGLRGQEPEPLAAIGRSGDAVAPAWATALFAAHTTLDGELTAVRYQPDAECFFNGDDPLALVAGIDGVVALSITPREPWPALATLDPFRANIVIEFLSTAPIAALEAAFRLIPDQVSIVRRPSPQAPATGVDAATSAAPNAAASVRVEAARIDALLDLVGELYTAKNALSDVAGLARSSAGGELARRTAASLREFDRLLAQLRQGVMRVRMVPLAQTLRRLPRVVRELSAQTGKRVDITITGGEIEADRSIVDGLFEPLLHIVRNALDHGIETGPERAAAGKPALGSLTITARLARDLISIEIADDGRGVDIERVRQKAVARGVVDDEAASRLDAEGVHELLFEPGFSTAVAVTELSGRGVGMDAVRSAIRALGGQVKMRSVAGHGSTVELMLPASFSMSWLLTVEAGGDRYAVPLSAVSETLRLPTAALIPVRAGRAFVLRDRTIPFLDLARLLDLATLPRDDVLVLVIATSNGPVGIGVDVIGNRAEIMVRPLAGLLKGAPGLAGTTVLGDGRVVMVLDIEGLVR